MTLLQLRPAGVRPARAALLGVALVFTGACSSCFHKDTTAVEGTTPNTSSERRTMNPLFRQISYYKDVAPFSFPPLDQFSAAAPPHGTWPTAGGGAGKTGRSGEPLVHDRFTVAWHAPLGAAAQPDGVLVADGRVIVNGIRQRGFWSDDGKSIGFIQREAGAAFIDVPGKRLLANDASSGVAVVSLDARQESSMVAAAPGEGRATAILQGPGALVIVTTHETPHGGAHTVVETLRVRDYTNIKNGTLYGIEPLAGITAEEDTAVVAAAGAKGPVLATRGGIDRRDWQLRPLGDHALAARPLALSVDEHDRAYLLSDDGGWTHLRVFPPSGEPIFDLQLSPDDAPFTQAPLVAPSGQIYVVSPKAILAVSPQGQILWRQERILPSPATLSGNGLLLIGSTSLDAVTPDGRHIILWHPPAPIATPPVLANDRIYVATTEELYALRPE